MTCYLLNAFKEVLQILFVKKLQFLNPSESVMNINTPVMKGLFKKKLFLTILVCYQFQVHVAFNNKKITRF